MAALPQWNLPSVEKLRALLDPDGTSLLVWDLFQQVVLPLHPDAAEALRRQRESGVTSDEARTFELLHYNGLGSAGHAHKRALRPVTMSPGVAKGHSVGHDGLAAVLQTRCASAHNATLSPID